MKWVCLLAVFLAFAGRVRADSLDSFLRVDYSSWTVTDCSDRGDPCDSFQLTREQANGPDFKGFRNLYSQYFTILDGQDAVCDLPSSLGYDPIWITFESDEISGVWLFGGWVHGSWGFDLHLAEPLRFPSSTDQTVPIIDGTVDLGGLDQFHEHWSITGGYVTMGATETAIPEPSVWILLLPIIAAVLYRTMPKSKAEGEHGLDTPR